MSFEGVYVKSRSASEAGCPVVVGIRANAHASDRAELAAGVANTLNSFGDLMVNAQVLG